MPSFDITSTVDLHELRNAIDQSNRELQCRFDFKGVDAQFAFDGKSTVHLHAPNAFQIEQMRDILHNKLAKRKIDTRALTYGDITHQMQKARQNVEVQQGISSEQAKKIVKSIKDTKQKVQASIQQDQVRVSGKKRDDLQSIMQHVKEAHPALALQFVNFRD